MKLLIFFLFFYIANCYITKEKTYVNNSIAARSSPNPLGKGIGMFYWYDRSLLKNVNCMKAEEYDSLFIYVYYENSIEEEALNVINDLYAQTGKDFKYEFMLLPSFTDENKDKSPEDVISAVNQSLSNIDLESKFMWLDTYFLSHPDANANINYISRLRTAAEKVNIRIDILTSASIWKQHMNNTDTFKKQGVLNWDDQAVSNAGTTEKYGGWQDAAVISRVPHYEICEIYHADVIYNIAALQSRTKVSSQSSFGLLLLVLSLSLFKF